MKQTPAHNIPNYDLLELIPTDIARVVDVGCMHGALAKAYRERNPKVDYIGIDIDPEYAEVAAAQCSRTLAGDIELLPQEVFDGLFPSDCWIFGDCLEHLRDPWLMVRRVREKITPDGWLLACIPNAQHWSVQLKLASGSLFYEDSGLLDRTHIRWFTRISIMKMFLDAGWTIDTALSRNLSVENQEKYLSAIGLMAEKAGLDPEMAMRDAQPFQYLFRVKANG